MPLLTQHEIHKLEAKISELESMTSAEFKIIFCQHTWTGIQRKGEKLFNKYGLNKTRERNTVLLLIVEKDRELLIYGDEGINEKSSTEHWPAVRDAILDDFHRGDYYIGLSTGIGMIAENLMRHFPSDDTNNNEVSNEILFV